MTRTCLKAALIEARAKLSGAEAMIEHLRLVTAKMRRETFGPRSEQRLIDQTELQLAAAAAGEDAAKVEIAGVSRFKVHASQGSAHSGRRYHGPGIRKGQHPNPTAVDLRAAGFNSPDCLPRM